MVGFVRFKKPILTSTPSSYRYVEDVSIIKRVSALEGDVVDFQGKRYKIPEGHCWVLGDNPAKSGDSRHYGAVPLQNLRQLVLFTFRFHPFRYKWVKL